MSEAEIVDIKRTITDTVSADDKSIGFDYQYYYFLYKVLTLKKGETVGLEVKDDVHTDLANDYQILVQVKHTVQENASRKPINLTTLDSDLWKTLSNWSKIISDQVAGRKESAEQLEFLRKTDFLLISNKSKSEKNDFFVVLDTPSKARELIAGIRAKSQNETIHGYIDDVLTLDDSVLKLFIEHLRLELEKDELIQQCKDALLEKQILPVEVDNLFAQLDSRIREANFQNVREGLHVELSFREFNLKYRRFFDLARSPDLVVKKNHKPLPSLLESQTFIKQLIDIGDISASEVGRMAEYTTYMLTVLSNLESWEEQGALSSDEIDQFKAEAKLHWENKFRSVYRNKKDDVDFAGELLDAMREVRLSLSSQPMDLSFSNGEFYSLSDIPEIGWMKSWEEKYK